ncbi:MAG: rhombotarget lipoprotein [Pseudomonadota bacterium]|nr:rhombotarget lipoprotein [Pseudomonadota bacterium]
MSVRLLIVVAVTLLLGACHGGSAYRGANRSSLVEFLYPGSQGQVVTPGVPQLALPLRVGVAFTPAQLLVNGGMTEAEKDRLAQDVVREFATLDFVDTIQVIPSDYLRQHGGFTNLDQLRSLFGIDVIVLLSYDQSLFTEQSRAAVAYWTIVGMYFVPGEKNDTSTLIDAAVFDIASRALLFRAPGTSLVKSHETLIKNPAQLREDSVRGFAEAGVELRQNLKRELEAFQQRVKEQPAQFVVTTRPGYTGSGSSEGLFLLLVVAVVCLLWHAQRRE